jgi:hypothetical protein
MLSGRARRPSLSAGEPSLVERKCGSNVAPMKTTTILATVGLLAIAIAVAPPAAAAPETECLRIYQAYHLGPVSIVSPDTCTVHIIWNGLHPCEDWNPEIC